jgi:hypothetical protein
MLSQIAHLLKTGAEGTTLPAGFTVERLFQAGQSQQGGSMVAYATNFHFSANDGYFIQAAGRARRINDDVSCDDAGAPAYPNCRAELQGLDRLVRTDLAVPVYRALTETDVPGTLANGWRQSDSGLFRYYELAGTAHVQVHKGVEYDIFGVIYTLDTICDKELNTLADGPIYGSVLYNAMWQNMAEEVDNGTPSPASRILDSTGTTIDRDIHGNALGGVRVPQMDYPMAKYGGRNSLAPGLPPGLAPLGNLFCVLAGTVDRFPDEKLDNLYGDWFSMRDSLSAAADILIADRFLRPEEKWKVVQSETWTIPTLGSFGVVTLGVGLIAAAWVSRRRMAGRSG